MARLDTYRSSASNRHQQRVQRCIRSQARRTADFAPFGVRSFCHSSYLLRHRTRWCCGFTFLSVSRNSRDKRASTNRFYARSHPTPSRALPINGPKISGCYLRQSRVALVAPLIDAAVCCVGMWSWGPTVIIHLSVAAKSPCTTTAATTRRPPDDVSRMGLHTALFPRLTFRCVLSLGCDAYRSTSYTGSLLLARLQADAFEHWQGGIA